MLAFPHSVRLYVALEPVDMRKQYDGLWAAASVQFGEDPSTTPLSNYEESRMTPERLKRVRQRGQKHRARASISQRRTSGSEQRFF